MRTALWLVLTGTFAAVNFAAASQAPERGQDTVYTYDVIVSAVIAYGFLLVLLLLLTNGLPRRDLLALRPPSSWPRALGLALVSLVVILIGAGAPAPAHERRRRAEPHSGEVGQQQGGAYAASFIAIVFIGPTVEELLYRGAGIGFLLPYGRWVAVGVTALVFGLGHGLVLSLGGLRLVRARDGVAPPAHGQPLPAAARPHDVQRAGMIAPLLL